MAEEFGDFSTNREMAPSGITCDIQFSVRLDSRIYYPKGKKSTFQILRVSQRREDLL
jgi:hypothetical protein